MDTHRGKRRSRISTWLGWAGIIISIIALWSNPYPVLKPDYVPTIVNGLVTSMSILIGFAIFQVTLTNSNIEDKLLKAKYRLRATLYVAALFVVLYISAFIGYRLVMEDDLEHAFSLFMSCFALMFGIIFNLPNETDVT